MKNIILCFLIALISFNSFSQNIDFNNGHSIPCKWDTIQNILGFDDWSVYQTFDSTMFGAVDSSLCIDVTDTLGFQLIIDMDDIDLTKSLYISYNFDSTNYFALDSNSLYGIFVPVWGSLFWDSIPLVDLSNNCPDGLCTAVYAEVETIFTGSGTVSSWYVGGYELSQFTGYGLYSCIATPNIGVSKIKQLIIRIQPIASSAGKELKINGVPVQESFFIQQFTDIHANFLVSNQNWIFNIDYNDYLGVYHDPTFPSAANISYLDVFPFTNSATVDTININVDNLGSINFQPYTQLRGGLILGSTTDRHVFNLNLLNGNVCLSSYIELIFWGNDRFTYSWGDVKFYGPRGCLLFGDGGRMVIADNAKFHYGKQQQGLLALLPGGTIEIGNNAELKISNTVLLDDYPTISGEKQVYMTLDKGSKLAFTVGSHIENLSDNPHMKLNIYMEGGQIDLSGLPKDELKYVHLIYRTPFTEKDKNLTIIQNPVYTILEFEYISEYAKTFNAEITDLNGALVLSKSIDASKGINFISIPIKTISNGIYFLNLTGGRETISKKWIKL